MSELAPKLLTEHIEKPAEQAALDAERVRQLTEHPGWKILMDSIDVRLSYEQKRMMSAATVGLEPARYERQIGEWNGLRRVAAIAEGIVRHGDKAAEALKRSA